MKEVFKGLYEWLQIPLFILLFFLALKIMMWGFLCLEALFDVPGWD